MKVLIVGRTAPLLPALLSGRGFQVDTHEEMSQRKFEALAPEYDILVVASGRCRVHAQLIDRLNHTLLIIRTASGIENIDREYAQQKGIAVLRVPEGNRHAVAEHTLLLMMAVLRALTALHHATTKGKWLRDRLPTHTLQGKRVGVVGWGNVGELVAFRLVRLGVRVFVYDPFRQPIHNPHLTVTASLEELLATTDIVTLHVPLTPQTHHMINKRVIERAPRPFILINTARGALVDLEALLWGLESSKISGAGLDVLPEEPPLSTTPLLQKIAQHPRVVLTPHMAGRTAEAMELLARITFQKIMLHLSITKGTNWWK